MNRDHCYRKAAKDVLDAQSDEFEYLVEISGLDKKEHFRFANLSDVDFGTANLDGFDFTGAQLFNCNFQNSRFANAEYSEAKVDESTVFFEGVDPFEVLALLQQTNGGDRVLVLSPEGDVFSLRRRATALDYAYHVHTEVGHHCVGAKVDGMRVPLWTKLKDGHTVEIITATGQTAQATWVDIAETPKARSKIRKRLREIDRERFIKLGAALLAKWEQDIGAKYRQFSEKLAGKKLPKSLIETIALSIGTAELEPGEAFALHVNQWLNGGAQNLGILGLAKVEEVRFCPNCVPLPETRIVGISSPRQVTVHDISCPKLEKFEDRPEKWLDLRWRELR